MTFRYAWMMMLTFWWAVIVAVLVILGAIDRAGRADWWPMAAFVFVVLGMCLLMAWLEAIELNRYEENE
jgi:hypothetical protein